jgi:hypothetical protein
VIVATADDERVLEGSTAAVWELLDRPLTEAELVARGADAFGMDPSTTAAALHALVTAALCRPT